MNLIDPKDSLDEKVHNWCLYAIRLVLRERYAYGRRGDYLPWGLQAKLNELRYLIESSEDTVSVDFEELFKLHSVAKQELCFRGLLFQDNEALLLLSAICRVLNNDSKFGITSVFGADFGDIEMHFSVFKGICVNMVNGKLVNGRNHWWIEGRCNRDAHDVRSTGVVIDVFCPYRNRLAIYWKLMSRFRCQRIGSNFSLLTEKLSSLCMVEDKGIKLRVSKRISNTHKTSCFCDNSGGQCGSEIFKYTSNVDYIRTEIVPDPFEFLSNFRSSMLLGGEYDWDKIFSYMLESIYSPDKGWVCFRCYESSSDNLCLSCAISKTFDTYNSISSFDKNLSKYHIQVKNGLVTKFRSVELADLIWVLITHALKPISHLHQTFLGSFSRGDNVDDDGMNFVRTIFTGVSHDDFTNLNFEELVVDKLIYYAEVCKFIYNSFIQGSRSRISLHERGVGCVSPNGETSCYIERRSLKKFFRTLLSPLLPHNGKYVRCIRFSSLGGQWLLDMEFYRKLRNLIHYITDTVLLFDNLDAQENFLYRGLPFPYCSCIKGLDRYSPPPWNHSSIKYRSGRLGYHCNKPRMKNGYVERISTHAKDLPTRRLVSSLISVMFKEWVILKNFGESVFGALSDYYEKKIDRGLDDDEFVDPILENVLPEISDIHFPLNQKEFPKMFETCAFLERTKTQVISKILFEVFRYFSVVQRTEICLTIASIIEESTIESPIEPSLIKLFLMACGKNKSENWVNEGESVSRLRVQKNPRRRGSEANVSFMYGLEEISRILQNNKSLFRSRLDASIDSLGRSLPSVLLSSGEKTIDTMVTEWHYLLTKPFFHVNIEQSTKKILSLSIDEPKAFNFLNTVLLIEGVYYN